MVEEPIRLVQISDIHLFADVNKELLGVKTQESFAEVLKQFKQETDKMDAMLLTGDLTQDGSQEAYKRLADMVKECLIPTYSIPGNHDEAKSLAKAYPCGTIRLDKQLILKNWQIILLDSQKSGAVEGFLAKQELDFMESCLKKFPNHFALICFHHQPIPVGCAWLDNIGLKNADELWKRLEKFSNAKVILFGHVHQEHAGEKNHTKYFSVPSCCIQFKTNSKEFALEKLPPGYRLIELYENGTIKTEVKRLPEYVGFFDVKSKGY